MKLKMLVLAAFAFMLFGLCFPKAVSAELIDFSRTITVEPGDTLWGLTNRYGAGATPAKIAELMELNNLETTQLHAGQVLQIPESWPMFVYLDDDDLSGVFSDTWEIQGGMMNSVFPNVHFKVVNGVWTAFENPSGYWDSWALAPVNMYLPKDQAWTVYPLGLTYTPGFGFTYPDSHGFGESMLFKDGARKYLSTSDVIVYEEYAWDGDWDQFVSSYYYERNTHYVTRSLIRNLENHFRIDVYSISILEIESEPIPADFGADLMSSDLSTDLYDVDWIMGEPITVTEVDYVDTIIEDTGWAGDSDQSEDNSVWTVTYPVPNYIRLERQNGEEVLFTDFHDLGIDRNHNSNYGSDPIEGEVLWVRPYSQMVLPEEPGGYGYLSVSEDKPYHTLSLVEANALASAIARDAITSMDIGIISGTHAVTYTTWNNQIGTHDMIAFTDGRHLGMNEYYKPEDGTCVIVPMWDDEYIETQDYLWVKEVALIEIAGRCDYSSIIELSSYDLVEIPAFLRRIDAQVWYFNYEHFGLPKQ